MPRTNCNIIKDLLPSYLDEICSTESKQLVENHFEECIRCKKLYEQAALETIQNKSANTSKEIDYFKNIRKNVNKKNKTLLVITGILFMLQLYFNFSTKFLYNSSDLIIYGNTIFLITIALALFPALPDFAEHPIPNKIKLPILSIEFGVMTYIFVLLTYIAYYCRTYDNQPFGINPENLGPFIDTQLRIFGVCFIITFVLTLFVSLRNKAICPSLCLLPLSGFSLMLDYVHLLKENSENIFLSSYIKPYAIVMCEVIVMVGTYIYVNRKKSI